MRVIAGTARGVPLRAPRGAATRPVTDRVKETLFAILGERVIGARVLDLYAGSGALGIEALSRGARHADFVERGRDALASLRENLRRTRLAESASVHAVAVERFVPSAAGGERLQSAYDLILMDPPYAERAILAPLERVVPMLRPGASVVVKHFWRTDVPEPPGLVRKRERRFGETALTFLEASAPAVTSDAAGTDAVEEA